MKYLDYYPARLSKGKKWYILYRFWHPKSGNWNSFRVYGNMNRIKDLNEREEYAKVLMESINRALKEIDPLEAISNEVII